MITSKDQLGYLLRFEKIPVRIVSLVPSLSELLVDLGLSDNLIGITKFCIFPEEVFKSTEKIGGTKQLNLQKIMDLKPDFILANKEENQKEQIDVLRSKFPVWISDIYNIKDCLNLIEDLGEIFQIQDKAKELTDNIKRNFAALNSNNSLKLLKNKTVRYFIWKKPYMVAGKNTFIDHILSSVIGMKNDTTTERYPEIDLKKICAPDFIFLSTEPYPFQEKHFKEFKQLFPNAKIALVDGTYFSWYGSRLTKTPDYLKKLITQIE